MTPSDYPATSDFPHQSNQVGIADSGARNQCFARNLFIKGTMSTSNKSIVPLTPSPEAYPDVAPYSNNSGLPTKETRRLDLLASRSDREINDVDIS